MGTLQDFNHFITHNIGYIENTRKLLSEQQKKFETYFNEVKKSREHEFAQITEHILADRSKLGPELNKKLDAALKSERKSFDDKLSELVEKEKKLLDEAEGIRSTSAQEEKKLKQKNKDLDAQEESLKVKNEELLKNIQDYNRRIKEMSKGFGFIRNIFRMRHVQKERKLLDEQQANLVLRIDALRKKWEDLDSEFASKDKERKDQWLKLTTDAAAIKTKIDHLRESQEQIIQRSALEKVLFERQVQIEPPAEGDPKCPRCSVPNPSSAHFCRICAQRLTQDRPDLLGSLEEIAELNHHYDNFSEGMKSSQEIIGLLVGLKTGLENFSKSVTDMISTQNKHSLSVLRLDIPPDARNYAKNFSRLQAIANGMDKSLHPLDFSSKIHSFIDEVFTEEKIKSFFESMGHELSHQADSQW